MNPEDVLQIMRDLTGEEIDGVVVKPDKEQDNLFVVPDLDADWVGAKEEDGWVVIRDCVPRHFWSDIPDESVQSAARVIDILLADSSESVNPRFIRLYHGGDIARKWFDTDQGLVVSHTRRIGSTIDAALEVVGARIYKYEVVNGKLDTDDIVLIEQLPF